MVDNLLKEAARRLFPPTCLLCGKPGHGELDLCIGCLEQFQNNATACARCALPLPSSSPALSLCGRCQKKAPAFDRILAPWLYEGTLAELIQQLKFNGKLAAGRSLGILLAKAVAADDEAPQLLLPVPQHPVQLGQRGYNHAAELARQLSRALHIPWSTRYLQKVRATRPQHGLDRRERVGNLRGCFHYDEERGHHHVAVIDDVVTTASTASEIARTLKRSGVEKVQVWALARTPRQH